EIASVRRPPDVTLQVWESLLRHRGFEIAAGKLVRNPSADLGIGLPPPPPSPVRMLSSNRGSGSVISSFRRANSFIPIPKEPVASTSHQPFRRTCTLPSLPSPESHGAASCPQNNAKSSTTSSLFSGLKFRVLGE